MKAHFQTPQTSFTWNGRLADRPLWWRTTQFQGRGGLFNSMKSALFKEIIHEMWRASHPPRMLKVAQHNSKHHRGTNVELKRASCKHMTTKLISLHWRRSVSLFYLKCGRPLGPIKHSVSLTGMLGGLSGPAEHKTDRVRKLPRWQTAAELVRASRHLVTRWAERVVRIAKTHTCLKTKTKSAPRPKRPDRVSRLHPRWPQRWRDLCLVLQIQTNGCDVVSPVRKTRKKIKERRNRTMHTMQRERDTTRQEEERGMWRKNNWNMKGWKEEGRLYLHFINRWMTFVVFI